MLAINQSPQDSTECGKRPFEAREHYSITVMLEFIRYSCLQQLVGRHAFTGMRGEQEASDKGITKLTDVWAWCSSK